MNFKVKINNIGKLKNATIAVRPLTILAGPNNTGKTFFSKTLYSVFNTMNSDLIWEQISHYMQPVHDALRRFEFLYKKRKSTRDTHGHLIKSANIIFQQLKKIYNTSISNKKQQIFSSLESEQEIKKILGQLITTYKDLMPFFEQEVQKKSILFNQEILNNIEKGIKGLEKIKQTSKEEEILAQGFSHVLKNNLTRNFQTANLQQLTRDKEQQASIDIKDICKIVINKSNIEALNLSHEGLSVLQDCSRVIYLESPFFWKLRDALLSVRRHPWRASSRKSLSIPKYFSDLNSMLLGELSGDIAFPDILDDIKKIIKGQIILDEGGSLQFKEFSGNFHSLHITATGVAQLGMLALLIEKKILDKGTVLFIDEPETNLHPAWQVEMMKILFKLVKEGVHIIMATHSADILKWLEVHLGKNPDDTELVALNEMILNENDEVYVTDSNDSIQEKVSVIKGNLTKPFLDLFLEEQE